MNNGLGAYHVNGTSRTAVLLSAGTTAIVLGFSGHPQEGQVKMRPSMSVTTAQRTIRQSFVASDYLCSAAKCAIGARGLSRLASFERLERGWDRHGALPMNIGSLHTMSEFLRRHEIQDDPSIFMTRSGCLALGWACDDGAEVELEFFPSKIEILVEYNQIEKTVRADEAGFLEISEAIRRV